MKISLSTLILFLAFQSCDSPQNQSKPGDVQIIQNLEEQWVNALVKDDSAAIATFLAKDFTFIEPDGSIKNRNEYLADRGNNLFETLSFNNSELKVSVYEDAALVSGLASIKEKYRGLTYKYQLRWKEMWIKENGGWKVLAGQATPVDSSYLSNFIVK